MEVFKIYVEIIKPLNAIYYRDLRPIPFYLPVVLGDLDITVSLDPYEYWIYDNYSFDFYINEKPEIIFKTSHLPTSWFHTSHLEINYEGEFYIYKINPSGTYTLVYNKFDCPKGFEDSKP